MNFDKNGKTSSTGEKPNEELSLNQKLDNLTELMKLNGTVDRITRLTFYSVWISAIGVILSSIFFIVNLIDSSFRYEKTISHEKCSIVIIEKEGYYHNDCE